jgi:hypothetical protein
LPRRVEDADGIGKVAGRDDLLCDHAAQRLVGAFDHRAREGDLEVDAAAGIAQKLLDRPEEARFPGRSRERLAVFVDDEELRLAALPDR